MKKTMMFALVALSAVAAKADYAYLNFLVDQSSSKEPIAFEYARVGVKGTDAYLNIQDSSSSWVMSETEYTTDSYYANLGTYASSAYAFFVEIYDEDFTKVGRSGAISYNDLKLFISTDMGQGGVTGAWTVSDFESVPEPTSGVLMLLGVGLLALRRKRRVACALALLLGLNVWADANDTLITFATVGPDKYADGTTVKDGECYALVWLKTGSAFAGFAADGTVIDKTNSVLLLTAPVAKDGKCPTTVFEINAKLAERYADGSFDVYLLDTRLANGSVGGVNAKGRAVALNGYGRVDVAASGGGSAAVLSASAVPSDAPKPTIKAIKVAGGNVYLTVSGTVSYLQYRARKVDVGGAATPSDVGESVQGVSGGDVIIVAPATGSCGFYQVGRP